MFLKNKKLRGMSLVELLAYTVILSIVTTALFQLMHFIEKMNDENVKQQELYNAFNLALLRLDKLVIENSVSGNNGRLVDLHSSNNKFHCLGSSNESFYFVQDSTSNTYYLCYDNNGCLPNLSASSNYPCSQTSDSKLVVEEPIFQTNGNFFTVDSNNSYDEVTFDFYVPQQPDLKMKFTSLSN
jgi:type II secretory pathway pseudopilin PulG